MLAITALLLAACSDNGPASVTGPDAAPGVTPDPVKVAAARLIDEGRQTFRYDTFGDEAFWGDTLHLNQAIAGAANGGVDVGVSPTAALSLGLKVDVDQLPPALVSALQAGTVDLNDPASTLALLREDAVVGVKGFFDGNTLRSVGITCAICHSTVDDSFAPGIGVRRDGWANRDLNVGAIIAAAPNLEAPAALLGVNQPTLRTVLMGWGPGKFDAAVFLDAKTTGPVGTSATLIPPAYGLLGVNLHTFTGWGSMTYWNAFVANLAMGGSGTFFDPRLENAAKFPVAAAANSGNRRPATDQVTAKLAALHFYQLAIEAPAPPAGSFDAAAATRGKTLFEGTAKCSTCHVPPLYTEPGWNSHRRGDRHRRLPGDAFPRRTLPDHASARALGASEG